MTRSVLIVIVALPLVPGDCPGQVVRGRVVDAAEGRPVAGALVRLLPAAVTDSAPTVETEADTAGAFVLRPPAAGAYRIAAAGGGFHESAPRAIALGRGDSVQVRLRLSRDSAVAEPLDVIRGGRARPSRDVEAFHRRAAQGSPGWFLTRGEIERRAPTVTTDLLAWARGLRVVSTRLGRAVRGRRGCVPAVYVDGGAIPADAVDLYTRPDELEGIEVYTVGAAPPEFTARGRECGVVLLWTRFAG